ncbi:TIR domain-containing protein [Altererythrobacter aquiaggeris]|uniref:TIR domain-containing protein n=1 Tax=Aestuarierythrobacter aquiaggeris TaxID=1898396 RepID=UPI0030163150
MSEIFVSYKRENRPVVEHLVCGLKNHGLNVWWDAEIEGGSRWRQEILDKLEMAAVVIVVWSKESAGQLGEFVQDEAAHAKARGTYLPVSIDGTDPPLGFRQVQVLPLIDWQGGEDENQFKALLRALRARFEPRAKTVRSAEPDPVPHKPFMFSDHSDRPSIAVLPFRHPPNDADQAYFAEGMAEDIIAGLSRSRLLRVTSRQSSLSYDAETVSTAQACADLSVRYLVRGQIRRMGSKARVRADLIDGDTDEVVWSGHQDRPIDEIFELQDSITNGIVGTIEPALLDLEQNRAARGSQDLRHWDLFIRGRYHYWRATFEHFRKAEEILLKALKLDPHDAPTLVLLALSQLGDIWGGRTKNFVETVKRANDYATRAVAADPRDATTHYALGIVLSLMGRFDQGMAEQRRSLDLNQGNAQALGELGRLLAFRGDPDEALEVNAEALSLSPNDPHDWLWLRSMSVAALRAGRPEEALRHARDALTRRPDFFFLHLQLAACSQRAGDNASARAACARGVELNDKYSLAALEWGHPYSERDDLEDFVGALREAGWTG